MDTIELPHDATAATVSLSRPIDIDDPHDRMEDGHPNDPDPAQGAPQGSADGPSVPPGMESSGRTPVSKPRKGRGQAILFGTTALLVVAVSAGVIFHRPLTAAWTRFRAHHPALASTIPLPKPRGAVGVLDHSGMGHGAISPIDNAIPGLAIVPGQAHEARPKSLRAPSPTPPQPSRLQSAPKPPDRPVLPAAATTHPKRLPPSDPVMGAATPLTSTPSADAQPSSPATQPAMPAVSPAVATLPHVPLVGPIPPKGTLQSIPHPVQAAAKLVAAPASRKDEVQTNSLVAALGRLIAELRSQNLALEEQITALRQHVDTRMTAFNQRLTFDQAHDALALAGAAHPAPISTSRIDAAPALQSAQVFPVTRKPMAPVSPAAYRIQAASPGLALIVRDGTTYEVSVGNVVPGVGRVISIVEDGSSWIVRTDHGVIR